MKLKRESVCMCVRERERERREREGKRERGGKEGGGARALKHYVELFP